MKVATVGWPVFPAVCAIALGFVIALAPRTRTSSCDNTKAGCAGPTVMKLAFEAFPRWSAEHPKRQCPASLEALLPWMDSRDLTDPWGRDYRFNCVFAPGRPVRIVVWSAGEDRRHQTADDVRSDR
jgi:hypothetical protein